MRVIVTRPLAQAVPWVQGLRQRGVDAAALPLLAIEPLDDARPVLAEWAHLARYSLVMFVSANAVERFFAAGVHDWPAQVLAGATGPGTVAALRAAGVPLSAVVAPDEAAGRFDSEALWQRLAEQTWAGRQVLLVRGEQGRDWLAETLQRSGAHVTFVAAYRRALPRWSAKEHAVAQAALSDPSAHLWSFSSSEGARHLRALLPAVEFAASAAAASHERIANAVRELGFGRVTLIAPDLPALAALASRAQALPARPKSGEGGP
jgi:uroporphyrinogen-III synthase